VAVHTPNAYPFSFSKCPRQYTATVRVHVVYTCAGKGLCMLTKEDCFKRAPLHGDIIYNALTVRMNNLPRVDEGQLAYLLLPLTHCP